MTLKEDAPASSEDPLFWDFTNEEARRDDDDELQQDANVGISQEDDNAYVETPQDDEPKAEEWKGFMNDNATNDTLESAAADSSDDNNNNCRRYTGWACACICCCCILPIIIVVAVIFGKATSPCTCEDLAEAVKAEGDTINGCYQEHLDAYMEGEFHDPNCNIDNVLFGTVLGLDDDFFTNTVPTSPTPAPDPTVPPAPTTLAPTKEQPLYKGQIQGVTGMCIQRNTTGHEDADVWGNPDNYFTAYNVYLAPCTDNEAQIFEYDPINDRILSQDGLCLSSQNNWFGAPNVRLGPCDMVESPHWYQDTIGRLRQRDDAFVCLDWGDRSFDDIAEIEDRGVNLYMESCQDDRDNQIFYTPKRFWGEEEEDQNLTSLYPAGSGYIRSIFGAGCVGFKPGAIDGLDVFKCDYGNENQTFLYDPNSETIALKGECLYVSDRDEPVNVWLGNSCPWSSPAPLDYRWYMDSQGRLVNQRNSSFVCLEFGTTDFFLSGYMFVDECTDSVRQQFTFSDGFWTTSVPSASPSMAPTITLDSGSGQIRIQSGEGCMHLEDDRLHIRECQDGITQQVFSYNPETEQIVVATGGCLSEKGWYMGISICNETSVFQKFYQDIGGRLRHRGSIDKCIGMEDSNPISASPGDLRFEYCSNDTRQVFITPEGFWGPEVSPPDFPDGTGALEFMSGVGCIGASPYLGIYRCNYEENQTFLYYPSTEQIRTFSGEKCLDDLSQLTFSSCVNVSSQRWYQDDKGRLRNRNRFDEDDCLEWGTDVYWEVRLQTVPCRDDFEFQVFNISENFWTRQTEAPTYSSASPTSQPSTSPTIYIAPGTGSISLNSGEGCITLESYRTFLNVENCTQEYTQIFAYNEDTLQIRLASDEICLVQIGIEVYLETCSSDFDDTSQRWYPDDQERIRNQNLGELYCLAWSGEEFHMGECNDDDNQKFTVPEGFWGSGQGGLYPEVATGGPTTGMTAQPTAAATSAPTVEVTGQPTIRATAGPTVGTTAVPTVETTVQPTVTASAQPTIESTTTEVSDQNTGDVPDRPQPPNELPATGSVPDREQTSNELPATGNIFERPERSNALPGNS